MATAAGSLALPYPISTDTPDGPAAFLALANRIEATLGVDSTWTSVSSFSTGFAGGLAVYRRVGRAVTLTFRVFTSGTAISATYNNRQILVLPTGYRPTATLYFCSAMNDGVSNGVGIYCTLSTTGALEASYEYTASVYISGTVTYVVT